VPFVRRSFVLPLPASTASCLRVCLCVRFVTCGLLHLRILPAVRFCGAALPLSCLLLPACCRVSPFSSAVFTGAGFYNTSFWMDTCHHRLRSPACRFPFPASPFCVLPAVTCRFVAAFLCCHLRSAAAFCLPGSVSACHLLRSTLLPAVTAGFLLRCRCVSLFLTVLACLPALPAPAAVHPDGITVCRVLDYLNACCLPAACLGLPAATLRLRLPPAVFCRARSCLRLCAVLPFRSLTGCISSAVLRCAAHTCRAARGSAATTRTDGSRLRFCRSLLLRTHHHLHLCNTCLLPGTGSACRFVRNSPACLPLLRYRVSLPACLSACRYHCLPAPACCRSFTTTGSAVTVSPFLSACRFSPFVTVPFRSPAFWVPIGAAASYHLPFWSTVHLFYRSTCVFSAWFISYGCARFFARCTCARSLRARAMDRICASGIYAAHTGHTDNWILSARSRAAQNRSSATLRFACCTLCLHLPACLLHVPAFLLPAFLRFTSVSYRFPAVPACRLPFACNAHRLPADSAATTVLYVLRCRTCLDCRRWNTCQFSAYLPQVTCRFSLPDSACRSCGFWVSSATFCLRAVALSPLPAWVVGF